MDDDPVYASLTQLTLFQMGESNPGAIELFPDVWGAVEAVTAPEQPARHSALERLEALNAARFSPLVAYVLATRLTDPDLELRTHIVKVLGGVLTPDEAGNPAPDAVRHHLTNALSRMRTREIYAILQVAVLDPGARAQIVRLFNACSFAGSQLAEILANRKVPLAIRQQAACFIGEVGFLDALPTLERMVARLETRIHGQRALSFVPLSSVDDANLLPDIKTALHLLRSP